MEKNNMSLKLATVTTWNNRLYKKFAHRFEETYNWDFPLTVYNEDDNLFSLVPDCKLFVNKWSESKTVNWKWDAVRFCYKVYAYCHMILNSPDLDGVIYIDADTVFYKPVDLNWIMEHIHRDECAVTYLGRGDHHTETGFLYFNLSHPHTKSFAKDMLKMYDEGLVFNHPQWHDAVMFDVVRKSYEKQGVLFHNIGDGAWGDGGHVHARSILGTVCDHTKGPRKDKGVSLENNLVRT